MPLYVHIAHTGAHTRSMWRAAPSMWSGVKSSPGQHILDHILPQGDPRSNTSARSKHATSNQRNRQVPRRARRGRTSPVWQAAPAVCRARKTHGCVPSSSVAPSSATLTTLVLHRAKPAQAARTCARGVREHRAKRHGSAHARPQRLHVEAYSATAPRSRARHARRALAAMLHAALRSLVC